MSYRELYNKPTLTVLSQDQIEQIHLATMEVLEHTGVRITHPKVLELLDGAGASVIGDRVRIPAQMVESSFYTHVGVSAEPWHLVREEICENTYQLCRTSCKKWPCT